MQKNLRVLNDKSLIFPLEEISQKKNYETNKSWEKDSFGQELCYHDRFDGQIQWKNWVEWCYMWRMLQFKRFIQWSKFWKKQSILKSPMQLRISLQISNFNYEKMNTEKIKPKLPFQPNIPCLFQINTLKCFIFLFL